MYENMAVPIKIALDCKIPIKTIIKGLLKLIFKEGFKY